MELTTLRHDFLFHSAGCVIAELETTGKIARPGPRANAHHNFSILRSAALDENDFERDECVGSFTRPLTLVGATKTQKLLRRSFCDLKFTAVLLSACVDLDFHCGC
jgi:hypothetical protein